MILAGLFPPIGSFFASLPEAVLGACTIMMFGSIIISGVQMLARAGFSQRNSIISSLLLSVGIGFTLIPEKFSYIPGNHSGCIFRKLYGCGVCTGLGTEPHTSGKNGN